MGTPVSSGNRGVLALGSSLVNLCLKAQPAADIVFLLGHRDNKPVQLCLGPEFRTTRVVPCRLSLKSKLRDHLLWILLLALVYRVSPRAVRSVIRRISPWIDTAASATVVGDIRGGDSFSDIYGIKNFLYGFVMAWTIVLVRGHIVQFPQTYGPYSTRLGRFLAGVLLRRSSVIIARDTESLAVAKALTRPSADVRLSPDVAFALPAVLPPLISFDPPATSTKRNVIGINVNGLMYNGGYTRRNMFGLQLDYPAFMVQLVRELLAECDGEIRLIPHTFAPPGHVESDVDASKAVLAGLAPDDRTRVRLLAGEYNQSELKGIIGQSNFFVGARMHACIAALSQGIPCVAVAYSRKFAGVFGSVGMGDWVVDARRISTAEAVASTMEQFRRRNAARSILALQSDAARSRLDAVFGSLFTGQPSAEHGERDLNAGRGSETFAS